MKKLLYIEEEFLNPILCKPFIDLHIKEKDTFLEAVTHSNSNESLTKTPDIPEPDGDGNYGAVYLGGDIDPITIEVNDDQLFKTVVHGVTNLCKSFDPDVALDYVGVVRWPIGTFMKPHFDKNDVHGEDVFAAMLYLNDDFEGGSTMFEDIEVKPERGKLVIFSNSQHLHYVNKVDKSERFVLSFWYSRP